MEIDKILVTLAGLGLSVFIYWYFLAYQEKVVSVVNNQVNILVDGGYQPQTIAIKQGSPTMLNFTRKDPSSCLEEVVLPDFGKKAYLPLNQSTSVTITPTQPGEYQFACGMNMYHGKIIVEA